MGFTVIHMGDNNEITSTDYESMDDVCLRCMRGIDNDDPTPAGLRRYGETQFCRACIVTCIVLLHQDPDTHQCMACAIVPKGK